jgi:hypothetical protein
MFVGLMLTDTVKPVYKGHSREPPVYKGHSREPPVYRGHSREPPVYKGHSREPENVPSFPVSVINSTVRGQKLLFFQNLNFFLYNFVFSKRKK